MKNSYDAQCNMMDSANHSLQEYQKAIEDADEKVSIATQVYDLVSFTCK